MDKSLQKKLVGAAVLIALVVIFLPMLLDGEKENESVSMQIEIPEKPVYQVPNRLQQSEPVGMPGAPVMPASPNGNPQAEADAPVAVAKPLDQRVADSQLTGETHTKPDEAIVTKPEVKPATKLGSIKPQAGAAKTDKTKKDAAKKSKPEKKPAKKASASGKAGAGAGYVVQVGSFSQEKNANSLKDKLASSGFPAFVQSVKINNKSIFRVKVGPRPSRDAADQLRLRLIDKASVEGIIVAHP